VFQLVSTMPRKEYKAGMEKLADVQIASGNLR
jgi:hypothetical protein